MDKNKNKEIQKQNSFIFDTSADMTRSLVVSDCYFGDGSSLVPLYQVTEKPIMIQNVNISSLNESERNEFLHSDVVAFGIQVLTVEELQKSYPQYYQYWLPNRSHAENEYVMVNDYNYGVSSTVNALYEIDNYAGIAKVLQRLPDERKIPYLYFPPFRIGEKLIFSPRKSRKWAFYNIANKIWTYEDVPEEFYPTKQYRGTFGSGWVYQDEIIFFPGESGVFAKYNIHTGKITYFYEWLKNCKHHIKNVDWGLFSSVIFYKKSIILASMQSNIIIEMNPENLSFVKSYNIGSSSCGFRSGILVPNSDDFYFIRFREPESDKWQETIIKWNIKSGKYKEIVQLPIKIEYENLQNACNIFIFWKNSLFITPYQGDSILQLDTTTDIITRVELNPKLTFFKSKADCYSWAKNLALPYVIIDEKRMTLIAQLPYDYSLIDIDFKTGVVSNQRKLYFEGLKELNFQNFFESNEIMFEEYGFNINDFIDNYVVNTHIKELTDNLNPVNDGKSGQQIYDYIKNLLLR